MKKGMIRPKLTFFCELEPDRLQELFSQPEVIQHLKILQAQVSLGLLDFSQQRAEIVRLLNKENIPVTAWLLLPKEQGYWFNLENAPQAIDRYSKFKSWSNENGLKWSGVGLDIEPDIQFIQQVLRDPRAGLMKCLPKLMNGTRVKKANAEYQAFLTQIRADGYFVESYQIPFLIDERRASSSVFQRLAGLVDLDSDREVLMLYSSFLRPHGAGLLWAYGAGAGGIGVGNAGGGVKMEGFREPDYLDWRELQRDLLLAYQHTDHIYVFSLEGCAQQGFLEKLTGFNWNQEPVIPVIGARNITRVRKLVHAILWSASHPWILLSIGLGLIWLVRRLKKLLSSGKRKRSGSELSPTY
jgi:hypothetical protein